jgi:BTB/POZ domain
MELEGYFRSEECLIKSATIIQPVIVQSVKGQDGWNGISSEIKNLVFRNCNVAFFPRGLAKIFPNLVSLTINGCGLAEISSSDLAGLESLSDLYLDRNQLVSIPSNLLENMKSLKTVSFLHNNIKYLSPKLLDHTDKLELVNFRGNETIDVLYSKAASSLNSIDQLRRIIAANCLPPVDERKSITDHVLVEMWTSKRFSDFIVEAESKEFKVHKCVLGMQSQVLAAAIESEMQERETNRLEIVDFTADAVEAFLEFLYTGKLEDGANAMEVFELAVKYDVKYLREFATDFIMDCIDDTNVINVLKFAKLHESTHIKRAAFATVKKILKESDLNKELMDNPDRVEELIKIKRDIAELNKKYKNLLIASEPSTSTANELLATPNYAFTFSLY